MAQTLLLADDNVTVQRVVALTFARHNLRVATVSDGAQAIQRLADDRPAAALISVSLPKVDGYEVARFVQRHPTLHDLPVLLLAGAFDTVDEDRVRDCGAAGVIFKPIDPELAVGRVKELLGPPARAPHAPEKTSVWTEHHHAAFEEEWLAESGGRGVITDTATPSGTPAAVAAVQPAPPAAAATSLVPGIGPADAFAVLLAEELGEEAPAVAPQANVELSGETIERLADALAERLMQKMFGEELRRTVHDVSERLVREEIDRIRNSRAPQRSL